MGRCNRRLNLKNLTLYDVRAHSEMILLSRDPLTDPLTCVSIIVIQYAMGRTFVEPLDITPTRANLSHQKFRMNTAYPAP